MLHALAAMKRDSDLNNLNKISTRMSDIQSEIQRIRDQVRFRNSDLELDPARLSGIDVVWQQNSESIVLSLQRRRAGLAAAREAYYDIARLSFRRADVLDSIRRKKS